MTSKHLFCKLCWEDTKRKAWAAALAGLFLFFALPTALAIVLPSYEANEYITLAETIQKRTNEAKIMLDFGTRYPAIRLLMFVAAVVLGISSFSYLHNKKQTDFYHSLPVKRSMLFLVRISVGFAIPAVLYLFAIFISMPVAAVNGIVPGQLFFSAARGYAGHMLYYGLIYMTTVLAMVMTGSKIAAVLGTAVFFFYFPMAGHLLLAYCQEFFDTFYYQFGPIWIMRLCQLSPFVIMGDAIAGGKLLVEGLTAAGVILLLGLLSFFLYQKRPCEAAGKTMAFEWSKAFIKVMLVTVFGMAGAVFFYAIQEGLGWMTFGAIVGVAISHCVIEIIYHGDFKKLFCHEKTMAACMTLVLAIVLSFYFDLFRYDAYLPQESQLAQLSICFGEDRWVTYEVDSVTGYDNWMDSHVLEVTKVQNLQAALRIAEEGIRQLEQGDDFLENHDTVGYIKMCYTLKSGRKVYRQYHMWKEPVLEEMDQIYGETEYKKALYPCFNLDLAEAAENMVYRETRVRDNVQNLSGTPEQWQAVVKAYQEELAGLTMSQRRYESVVGELLFISRQDDQLFQSLHNGIGSRYDRYSWYNGFFYPVYQSFTKTIAALSDCGITVGESYSLDKLNLIEITVWSYEEEELSEIEEWTDLEEDEFAFLDSNGACTLVFREPEKMEAILKSCASRVNWDKNSMLLVEPDYEISLYFQGSGDDPDKSYFLKGQVPEFVKEAIQKAIKENKEPDR